VSRRHAVIAGNDHTACQEERPEGTLTIGNLNDALKSRLRMRAAARNRSMEEEARQILRAALQVPLTQTQDLGTRIRARFAALGDVQLVAEARQTGRPVSQFDAQIAAIARHAGAKLATRGIDDFQNCGVSVVNPWSPTRRPLI